MEPITTSALVAVLAKVFDAATGEAGKEAWGTLTGLVKKTFGRRSAPVEAAGELERSPGDQAGIEALAGTLAAEARNDPEFADELRRWLADAQRAATGEGDVTNVVGGSAQVSGPVVQARDISGGITFGDQS